MYCNIIFENKFLCDNCLLANFGFIKSPFYKKNVILSLSLLYVGLGSMDKKNNNLKHFEPNFQQSGKKTIIALLYAFIFFFLLQMK